MILEKVQSNDKSQGLGCTYLGELANDITFSESTLMAIRKLPWTLAFQVPKTSLLLF